MNGKGNSDINMGFPGGSDGKESACSIQMNIMERSVDSQIACTFAKAEVEVRRLDLCAS